MKLRSIISMLAFCLAALTAAGCGTGPKAPSATDAAAITAQTKQTTQKNIDVIQNNPNMSPDQKAALIAHLNNPQSSVQAR